MPSPIAHVAMGYLVYRAFRSRMPEQASRRVGPLPHLLIAAVGISLLPDADAVPGVLLRDIGRFHNNITHSLIFGSTIAVGIGAVAWLTRRTGFKLWFLLALVSYELHILMDFFTRSGRGVMLGWPISPDRFEAPVKLFYGLRWSEGLSSPEHLVTIATELGVVALAGMVIYLINRMKRPGDLSHVKPSVSDEQ